MKVAVEKLSLVCVSILVLGLIWTGPSAAKVDLKNAVGVWLFEGKGDVAKDETGNGHDGKIIGAKRVGGKVGQALEFDGKADYVEIEPDKSLNPTDKITVVAWVKSTINVLSNKMLQFQKNDFFNAETQRHALERSEGTQR